ncbi:GNAT family N-acetyltransferase [Kitasatospora sp. NPDC059803]|uniref:GNAT family N-acetyltransferase n=1 Tax=Kitasatospora sp. NPDC059803 TaxID=3346953 RepID=UPI00364B3106
MDASLYRIRPLRAADIDAALELMRMANPAYATQDLRASRHLLEVACAPPGSGLPDDALRVMAEEMARSAAGISVDADTVHAMLKKRNASGDLVANGLISKVAEELSTGSVVGVANAGAPGKWAHYAFTQLPELMGRQLRERVVEVSDIAVVPAVRRRGIGQELMNAVLETDSERAQQWRVAIWFFPETAGGFHRAMAPEWPAGQPIAFLDSVGGYAAFRNMTGDFRACVAPLHPTVGLVVDPDTGRTAIEGVFDQPWSPAATGGHGAGPSTRGSKADRKREKKLRGRARG